MKTLIQTLMLTLTIALFTACGGDKNSNSTHDNAIDKLSAYAQSNGTSSVPTLQDYLDAGVTGIDTETKLSEINQVVEGLNQEEVDTTEEVQVLANELGVSVTIPTTPKPTKPSPSPSPSPSPNPSPSPSPSPSPNPSPTPDTTPPVITITGGNTVSVVQFSTYTDAGATAVDAVDGTVSATTTGSVNTSTTGVYDINYTATDAAGNTATATRTVTVTASITHNGISYGAVVSPYTGKVWLDRNLGASQVCTSFDDANCYGDYYQWGRNADGHEDSMSNITTTIALNVNNVGHGYFIGTFDWASVDITGTIRSANWSAINGNSVCPIDFRVPTRAELKSELYDVGSAQIANRNDAFNSFLKLPSAGDRAYFLGAMANIGTAGFVWSVSSATGISDPISFSEFSASATIQGFRGHGLSVRCIKN